MTVTLHPYEAYFRECFHPEFIRDLGEIKLEGEYILAVSCSPYYFNLAAENIYGSKKLNAYVLGYFADPEGGESNSIILSLLFRVSAMPELVIRLYCRTPLQSSINSLSKAIPATNWMQQEISELYGLCFKNSVLPAVILHEPEPDTFNFVDPQITGQHQVAVGPIHAGIIEPGHLRFFVRGEKIYSFQAQLFYTHRGIEKMAVGKTATEALVLAEHVCGLCACTHATAFCQAVESFYGLVIPPRARFLRAILLELERLSYHSADLSAICASGGLSFGAMQAAAIREVLLRCNKALTGHRFFRGVIAVGGLKKDILDTDLLTLQSELSDLLHKMELLRDLITNSSSLLDRLETTGTLPLEKARLFGLSGPVARASGISFDLRSDDKFYQPYQIRVPVYQEGDCWARTMVRLDEWPESVRLIKALIQDLPGGDINLTIDNSMGGSGLSYGIGAVESAKGETVHFVRFDEDYRIARWYLRSASFLNWAGMVEATSADPNNIVADGPLINKSFNLCYACSDK